MAKTKWPTITGHLWETFLQPRNLTSAGQGGPEQLPDYLKGGVCLPRGKRVGANGVAHTRGLSECPLGGPFGETPVFLKNTPYGGYGPKRKFSGV